ncbi:hypothetical protein RI129_012091 [Pyrocoelia pectoralis]|uniref:C2H2-type domain-containing protein n=1 Tax=Pyrocoelia pectoralis TaxID=417401 RepID=A0AAN7V966_9COLE
MTTSATLPSTTGPVHAGGFSTISEDTAADDPVFETPRPMKRCLIAPLTDSCKKRRKQATPVRISAADSDLVPSEGKLSIASPEPELQCPLCQLTFNAADRLQNHLTTEHANVHCKKEPEDAPTAPNYERCETPIEMPASRSELPWINDLQNKEWINPNLHGVQFSPATSLFMTLPPFTQPDNIPTRQPVRIFNPDAYCDLCNKEFCNKYFLKTHKANKHGIYSDPPVTETLGTTVSIPSYASNIKIPVSSNSNNTEIASTKTDPKLQSNPANPFSELFPSNPTLFSNKLFPKISKPIQPMFESEVSENATTPDFNTSSTSLCNGQTDRTALNEDTMAEETSSPKAIQHDVSLLKNEFNFDEGTYFTSPSKMSPGQQSREIDLNRLRRIGVMNPKAFCEICCKEYCNKYFLRTHKMKRHGIYIPDDSKDGKEMKMESNWSHNMQTSPLNLIMAEQTNSNTSERKTNSPADISCDTCGIKFQNASLAQLHNVSVHSRLPQGNHDTSELFPEDVARCAPEYQNTGDKSVNSADAISEDLQKLQTMILQLNDIDVNRTASTCNVCSKELENRYYLHAHMMAEHGLLVEDGADPEKNVEEENIVNNNSSCDLCSKEMQSVDDMKKHLLEFHPNQHISDIKEEAFINAEKGPMRGSSVTGSFPDRRSSMSLTPSSSYCEICNKELCNKYFMKTHMQRMHGIEIENGAQIGGVICDICNKELCSKYFLRVHKHNTHGIVEYGSSLLQPRKTDPETTPLLPTEQDSALKPGDLADLSHRYFTHFTEVCTICSRRFRSTKWLKAHLLSDHGQTGAEKWAELEQQLQQSLGQNSKSTSVRTPQSDRASPTLKIPNGNQDGTSKVGLQNVLSTIFGTDETAPKNYHCSYCPFSTPVLPFLFVHERSHSMQPSEGDTTSPKCPVCTQNFAQTEMLQHHLFTQHPFFPLPPFFNGNAESHQENQTPKDNFDCLEEDSKTDEAEISPNESSKQLCSKSKKVKRKLNRLELSPEVNQSLKDVAKRSQLPATYALPQIGEQTGTSGYVMQAFLLDESAVERRFVPSVVFLPVLQKQSAPVTVTFTLTPA